MLCHNTTTSDVTRYSTDDTHCLRHDLLRRTAHILQRQEEANAKYQPQVTNVNFKVIADHFTDTMPSNAKYSPLQLHSEYSNYLGHAEAFMNYETNQTAVFMGKQRTFYALQLAVCTCEAPCYCVTVLLLRCTDIHRITACY
jgi:hypothetical protein